MKSPEAEAISTHAPGSIALSGEREVSISLLNTHRWPRRSRLSLPFLSISVACDDND